MRQFIPSFAQAMASDTISSSSSPPEDDDASQDDDAAPAPPLGPYTAPAVCLSSTVRDAFAGGVMGSVVGFGQGIWKKQGLKGTIREAGSSAKMFAVLSGVHTLVSCFLKQVRGKHDAVNAGIAGCATGLALSTPGTPEALLRSCLTFGAFSYVLDRFSRPQVAEAACNNPLLNVRPRRELTFPVLPPFVLPPPCLEGLTVLYKRKFGSYISSR